ncbi:hypothetical protein HDV00_012708 [Rhizophlyctis rosea]|nr:hypothetical protein HDV00_012708 [Rhizophlyctis rosea]
MPAAMGPFIRPYVPTDSNAVGHVCLLSTNNGTSAQGLYKLGDDVVANLFAHPYTHFHPNLAFVLDDGAGTAVGYLVGTPDTAAFHTLYINLLPRYQGKGYGKELMKRFLDATRDVGVDSVRVQIEAANVKAVGFCEKVGFHVIDMELGNPASSTPFGRSMDWIEV